MIANVHNCLSIARTAYGALANKRGEVREALAIYRSIQDAEARREKIESRSDEQKGTSVSEGDLPSSVADEFAVAVEAILKDWYFPESERVFFHPKARDLVIGGKLRFARGKGMRAITHAAFTIGLMQFCRSKETPHPSFVILDTPLRNYRKPEGQEEDLRGTDLDVKFYDYLLALGKRVVLAALAPGGLF